VWLDQKNCTIFTFTKYLRCISTINQLFLFNKLSFFTSFLISGVSIQSSGKVHPYGGTVELIELRIMSNESMARGQTIHCKIFGKGIKDKEKKHGLSRLGILRTHYPNANADVESSHRLIEDEFYCIESFSSVKDFLVKASSYQFYFNFLRKNSYKKFKTPLDILKDYKISPSIAFMPPLPNRDSTNNSR